MQKQRPRQARGEHGMPGEASSSCPTPGASCLWAPCLCSLHLSAVLGSSRASTPPAPAPGGCGHWKPHLLGTLGSLWDLFRTNVVFIGEMKKKSPRLLAQEIKRARLLGAGKERWEEAALLFKTCQVETFTETLILLIKQEKTFVVKLMQLQNNRTN